MVQPLTVKFELKAEGGRRQGQKVFQGTAFPAEDMAGKAFRQEVIQEWVPEETSVKCGGGRIKD